MFTQNNTTKCRDSLTKEKLAEVMKIARKSKSNQVDLYLKWKVIIHKTCPERLQNKIGERKQKELALTLEKEKLPFQLRKLGVCGQQKSKQKNILQIVTLKKKDELPSKLS